MAQTRPRTPVEPRAPAGRGPGADGPRTAVRRAPFSDNPEVGARGQRTQQRILDVALELFGSVGYHQTSVDRITSTAGCSRATFYQYFSSREDVFQALTGQVARQLDASAELLRPITADAAGWHSVRAWLARHQEIYRRYEPVFHAFPAASASDETVATGSVRWQERNLAQIRSRVVDPALPPRQLDRVILLLLSSWARAEDMSTILRSRLPDAYEPGAVADAATDVFHRSLFGVDGEVNVHAAEGPRPPRLAFEPAMRRAFQPDALGADLTPAGRQTLDALLAAGREVFVRKGYLASRVDDVAREAGVSHGILYRYFENKDHLAQVLTAQAMVTMAGVLADVPEAAAMDGPEGRAALRRWLRRYNATQADEAAMLRVWVDAALQDPALEFSSAPALDWGRRHLARFLAPRDFGDADLDGLLLVALLSAFGVVKRPAGDVDATAHIVLQGFLGL